jgi:hypothetical protein
VKSSLLHYIFTRLLPTDHLVTTTQKWNYNATHIPTVQCISFVPILHRISRLSFFSDGIESVCAYVFVNYDNYGFTVSKGCAPIRATCSANNKRATIFIQHNLLIKRKQMCWSTISQMQEVVVKYMDRVQRKTGVPRFSFGRGLLRDDGGPNKLFFSYLFGDDALSISFLQDAKLIRSQVLCDTCGRFMSCKADPAYSDGFRSRCSTRNAVIRCRIFGVTLSHNPTDNSSARYRRFIHHLY